MKSILHVEQSQTIHQSEPYASSRLRSALLANGAALEIEGNQLAISHNCYLFTFELSWHTRLRQRACSRI